jgi:hypothetical protein
VASVCVPMTDDAVVDLSLALHDVVWCWYTDLISSTLFLNERRAAGPAAYWAPAKIVKMPADERGVVQCEFFHHGSRVSCDVVPAESTAKIRPWLSLTESVALDSCPVGVERDHIRAACGRARKWEKQVQQRAAGRAELRAGMFVSFYDPTKLISAESYHEDVKILAVAPRCDANDQAVAVAEAAAAAAAALKVNTNDDDDDDDLDYSMSSAFKKHKRLASHFSKPASTHKPPPPAASPVVTRAVQAGQYSDFEYPLRLDSVPFPLDRRKEINTSDGVTGDIQSFWYVSLCGDATSELVRFDCVFFIGHYTCVSNPMSDVSMVRCACLVFGSVSVWGGG